ncbi:MAG TPA: hypothetical protein PKI89_13500 [Tepidiformaceae bacterium]|nr:hypothetical protein [Dehalococcoidia bacterium]HNM79383.1 hypothetical protein [Tepidiformaceae bacterium]
MSSPTLKEELHSLIERLSDEEAEQMLDYINMRLDPDELTPEEVEAVLAARREFERGETVTLAELLAELGE